jgi:GNAT superfamily N-acetyltransferase
MDDLSGILAAVRQCQPFLTAHVSYLYWIYTRYYAETCAIAEVGGMVAGWCHANAVGGGRYFSHQTAVAPWARGLGIGRMLWAHVLNRLKHEPCFVLEFTIERRNAAALKMLTAAAIEAGLCLTKTGEKASLLEDDCCEEVCRISATAMREDGTGDALPITQPLPSFEPARFDLSRTTATTNDQGAGAVHLGEDWRSDATGLYA